MGLAQDIPLTGAFPTSDRHQGLTPVHDLTTTFAVWRNYKIVYDHVAQSETLLQENVVSGKALRFVTRAELESFLGTSDIT
jgi:hypothetical protein